MSVLYGADVSPEQKEAADVIFAAVGQTEWLTNEQDLDWVTALSGSGPAYFFRLIEALVKAAHAVVCFVVCCPPDGRRHP